MNLAIPENPFRPGAGHTPVYLAGREDEQQQFRDLLAQKPVLQNCIITGLRGVGKTVLLETFKPIAQSQGWLWAGNDLTERASLTEEDLLKRVIVDFSTLLGPMLMYTQQSLPFGFGREAETQSRPLQFDDLWNICKETPGHADDKLKAVLLRVSQLVAGTKLKGIVFAYDEAQNLADHAADRQFPLSVLLDAFSWIQRQRLPCQFLLVLTGLPTLFPKLNNARTYTERMFHVLTLDSLNMVDAHAAIVKPIEIKKSPLTFSDNVISQIIKESGGYPYFIQFMCKEVFDAWITKIQQGEAPSVPANEIIAKLDQDFFSSRWQNATTRQQDFMRVIATLKSSESEFTVQEIVAACKSILRKGFSASHTNQMLSDLIETGLIYKSRRGGYRFAVPLLSGFIIRQQWDPASLRTRASSPDGA
jgi:hypothetical protein